MRDTGPAGGAGAQAQAHASFADDGRTLLLRFPVRVGCLAWAQAAATRFLQRHGRDERLIGRAELLLEELATNVVNHGAVIDPEAQFVVSLAVEDGGGCHLVFEDPGRPFDPVGAVLPVHPARLEEARIGGLGLVLLRRMARDLAHVALPGGGNRLSFRLDPAG